MFFMVALSVVLTNGVFATTDANSRLLGQYTDELVERLWRHSTISAKDIEDRLDFVNNPAACLSRSPRFETLTEKSNYFMEEESFVEFAETCTHFHGILTDDEKKSALCLLFDAVMKKYKTPYTLLQKMKHSSGHDRGTAYVAPQFLGTADRSQSLLKPVF